MRVPRYVSLLLAVQFVAACSQDAAPVPQQQAETRQATAKIAEMADEQLVLAFGDSLYAGYGLDQDQSFPAVLERQLEGQGIPARVVNAGVSGDTTAAGLARLSFTLEGLPRKPDLAIVGLGANDALRGVDPSETRRNLDAIMSELKRRGIPVVITGMMAPRNLGRDYSSRFDAIYPDLAKRYDARLDPFFLDGVITTPDLLLKDGIHPNAAGIEIMVKRVGPLVAQELRRS
jgi:acyl-CoA thioesterase-1